MKPIKAILGASVLAAALGMGCTWASEARMAAEREGWHNVEVGDYHTESTICKYVFEESATAYEVKGVLDDGKKWKALSVVYPANLASLRIGITHCNKPVLFYSYFCVFLKLAPPAKVI